MTGNKQYIHTHIHPLSSLLRLCSYPTVVEQKTTHFAATFLSLWKGQHYRFTDSILLIHFCSMAKPLPSSQRETCRV